MSEYLFVGGSWDGQRREVEDVNGKPAVGVVVITDDNNRVVYDRQCLVHVADIFVLEGMSKEKCVAALLENYRPLTVMADQPLVRDAVLPPMEMNLETKVSVVTGG